MAQAAGNAAGTKQILDYAKAKYRNYHGGEDGWEQLMDSVSVGGQAAPSAGFSQSLKPEPTPAGIAPQAGKENNPTALFFSDSAFSLSTPDAAPRNKEAA